MATPILGVRSVAGRALHFRAPFFGGGGGGGGVEGKLVLWKGESADKIYDKST